MRIETYLGTVTGWANSIAPEFESALPFKEFAKAHRTDPELYREIYRLAEGKSLSISVYGGTHVKTFVKKS